MAKLIFFGGCKGGVGKTQACRTGIQYHLDHNIPCTVFETDRSNPDVLRIYEPHIDCKVAIFSEGERYEDKANNIYNIATKQRVLVNLPAQVFIPLKNWIEQNELFSICQEDGVNFFMFFVTDGGYDSLKLFEQSVTYFKRDIPHVLVKNWGRCDDWSALEEQTHLQDLINEFEVKVIDFPKFIGTADRNRLDTESLSFGKALESKKFGSISKQRIRKFLREAYEQFDLSGVFK